MTETASYTSTHAAYTYPVMESFYTLQGEGAFTGHAAWFIRLGGCDVGCVWCDVKESWDADKHPRKSVAEMVDEASASGCQIVVITGGEPLLHDLLPLTEALQQAGLQVHLETSGSSSLSGRFNWICLSPKKFKAPLPELLPLAHELKTVVYNASDFAWADQYAALVGDHCKCFLQPEWSRAAKMLPEIVKYILANPRWTLSLQTHKYIGVP